MRRRGTPILQMQTAVFAVLTICSIVLVLSTVKLGAGIRVADLTVTSKTLAVQSTPQDSFAYVIVMLAALAAIASSGLMRGTAHRTGLVLAEWPVQRVPDGSRKANCDGGYVHFCGKVS